MGWEGDERTRKGKVGKWKGICVSKKRGEGRRNGDLPSPLKVCAAGEFFFVFLLRMRLGFTELED